MFFLFRLILCIGLVLLLLPLGLKGTDGREVSIFDAFGAAQAIVADMRGFCDRQPQACAVGGQMITHIGEKAQVGAKWLFDSLGSAKPGAGGAPAQVPPPAPQGQAGGIELTPQDLAPVWGGGDNGRTIAPAPVPLAPSGPITPLPPRRPA